MKQNVNFYAFRDAFIRMDRQRNFPGDGLSVLWDYLGAYEEEIGEEIELDVIALCCEYAQDTWQSIADDHGIDLSDCDDDERKAAVIEYLQESTAYVGEANGDELIYQLF